MPDFVRRYCCHPRTATAVLTVNATDTTSPEKQNMTKTNKRRKNHEHQGSTGDDKRRKGNPDDHDRLEGNSSSAALEDDVVGMESGAGTAAIRSRGSRKSPATFNASSLFKRNCGSSNSSGQKFLQVHLQILQTLYRSDVRKESVDENTNRNSSEDDDDHNNDDDDGPVPSEQWKLIDDFSHIRDRLRSLSHQVERMGGIHQESEMFRQQIEKEHSVLAKARTNSVGGSHTLLDQDDFFLAANAERRHWRTDSIPNAPSSLLQASPRCYSSSPLKTPKNLKGATKTNTTASSINSNINQRATSTAKVDNDAYGCHANANQGMKMTMNSAGITSALLKRKHHVAYEHWKKQIEPFHDLSNQIMDRVQILREQHEKLSYNVIRQTVQQSSVDNSPMQQPQQRQHTRMNNDNEEARVRINTKIELWTILHKDLVDACRNDMAKWSQELTESQQWQ